jgi:hypothetical protein
MVNAPRPVARAAMQQVEPSLVACQEEFAKGVSSCRSVAAALGMLG